MDEVLVTTRQGRARGVELDGVVRFGGLPYAAAPDPKRARFSPPVDPPAWSGVRDASGFGPVAPQPAAAPGYLPGEAAEQDEECRSLNVWAPTGPARGLPVLVFVHGGAFVSGSGSSRLYHGEHLARRGAVVVTFNYRLGALGFLAHPGLARPGLAGCANFGLMDQVAALSWVRDHAEAFGGDPAKVTVFGESAGAMSVCDLVGMPAARGLFSRAIVQSGAAVAHRLPAAARIADRFAAALGVASPSADALQGVPLEDLLAAQGELVGSVDEGLGMPFAPTVDGGLLEAHPADLVAGGSGTPGAELLVGTNRDEFAFFTFLSRRAKDLAEADLEALVAAYLRSAGLEDGRPGASRVVEAYRRARVARDGEAGPREVFEAFGTDFVFRIPQLRMLEAHARHGAAVFAYRFDWPSPFAGGALGACHGIELPFVFGSLREPVVGVFSGTSEAAVTLSDAVGEAWVAFARRGDPSSEALGTWPAYEETRRSTMRLSDEPGVLDRPGEAERSFWDEHLGRYGVDGPIEGAVASGVAFLDGAGEADGGRAPGT